MSESTGPSWGAVLMVPAVITALALTAGFWAQIATLRQVDSRFDERMTAQAQRLNTLTARVMDLDDRQRQIAVNTDRLTKLEEHFQRLDEEGSRATILVEERLKQLERRLKLNGRAANGYSKR